MIAKEQSEDEAKKWELKLNKNDVKVFIKKGGSHLNENMPYIKTEVLFNSYFQMNKIIKAVSNLIRYSCIFRFTRESIDKNGIKTY